MEKRKDGRVEGWKDFGTMNPETINACPVRSLRLCRDDCRLTSEKNRTMNEKLGLRFLSTQDIIDAAFADKLPDKIMITVHPQRWSDSFLPWIRELVWQNFKNQVKKYVVRSKQYEALEPWNVE
ncbi:hypothetical protein H8E88_03550 [candidate division KSB1 bacterium]|nr:hypothetical protein [candidate division KSB1 bacterium]MBL7105877.1 hypothetical protein [Bacteroidales bacterium]